MPNVRNVHNAISAGCLLCPGPEPTLVAFLNLCPKTVQRIHLPMPYVLAPSVVPGLADSPSYGLAGKWLPFSDASKAFAVYKSFLPFLKKVRVFSPSFSHRITVIMLLTLITGQYTLNTVGAQSHQDTANVYVGTVELGNNAGPDIGRFLASVGLDEGYAYCSAFVSFCLDAPSQAPTAPRVRSALAQDFITDASHSARDVLVGVYKPVRGTILVWKKRNGPYGHVGLVLVWNGGCGYTVEANTSNGTFGSQRDGDGVYVRRRCIEPGNYFRIVSFTPVEYEN